MFAFLGLSFALSSGKGNPRRDWPFWVGFSEAKGELWKETANQTTHYSDLQMCCCSGCCWHCTGIKLEKTVHLENACDGQALNSPIKRLLNRIYKSTRGHRSSGDPRSTGKPCPSLGKGRVNSCGLNLPVSLIGMLFLLNQSSLWNRTDLPPTSHYLFGQQHPALLWPSGTSFSNLD